MSNVVGLINSLILLHLLRQISMLIMLMRTSAGAAIACLSFLARESLFAPSDFSCDMRAGTIPHFKSQLSWLCNHACFLAKRFKRSSGCCEKFLVISARALASITIDSFTIDPTMLISMSINAPAKVFHFPQCAFRQLSDVLSCRTGKEKGLFDASLRTGMVVFC